MLRLRVINIISQHHVKDCQHILLCKIISLRDGKFFSRKSMVYVGVGKQSYKNAYRQKRATAFSLTEHEAESSNIRGMTLPLLFV